MSNFNTVVNSGTISLMQIEPVFPPELWLNIVAQIGNVKLIDNSLSKEATRATLCNLRLVNSVSYDFATPYLFHTITTWLVQYQLRRLGQISCQERLRHHVKRIVIRPWEVRKIEVGQYLAEVWCCDLRTHNRQMPTGLTYANFNDYVQNFSAFPIIGAETSGYGVFGRMSEIRQTWSPPTYTEEFLRMGEHEYLDNFRCQCHRRANMVLDASQLAGKFKKFDNLMHITIAPEEARDNNNRFVEITGIAPHPLLNINGMYVITLVVSALIFAKVQVRRLEIDAGRSEHYFWNRTGFNVFRKEPNYPYPLPFASLEKLCITQIGLGFSCHAPGPDPFVSQRPIAHLLKTSPLLNELTIGLHRRWRDLWDINLMIPSDLKIEGLRFLELRWFMIEEKKLLHILYSHESTLRTLNLRDITLSLGTWSAFAETLRCKLNLTHANFSSLWKHYNVPGSNNNPIIWKRRQRSCFADHPDRDLAGRLDDYITRKINYNPLKRAVDTGYNVEKDEWLPGTAAGRGWKSRAGFVCRCDKHMLISLPNT